MERGHKFCILRLKTILDFQNKSFKFPACCRFKWEITLEKKNYHCTYEFSYNLFWVFVRMSENPSEKFYRWDSYFIFVMLCYVSSMKNFYFVYWCYSHFQVASNHNFQWWLKILSQADCWSVCFVAIFSKFYWYF